MNNKIIYLDLDGVFVDLIQGICNIHELEYDDSLTIPKYSDWYKSFHKDGKYLTSEEFRKILRSYDIWEHSPGYSWNYDLFKFVKDFAMYHEADLAICSTPPKMALYDAHIGKLNWLAKQFGFPQSVLLVENKGVLGHPRAILLDDKDENIAEFTDNGGHGILFPQPWNAFRFVIDTPNEDKKISNRLESVFADFKNIGAIWAN